MPYSKFFSESKATKAKGKGGKLPLDVVARLVKAQEIQKRIDAIEWFLLYQDHSMPYTLPVGEYAWHEEKKGKV